MNGTCALATAVAKAALVDDREMYPSPDGFRQRALSRWDNEGGATVALPPEAHADMRDLTNAELVLLRLRVIALENLLIAILAEGSDRQRQAARDIAAAITPREGFSQHPLTIRAAQHMADLADRAERLSSAQP